MDAEIVETGRTVNAAEDLWRIGWKTCLFVHREQAGKAISKDG